MRERFSPQAVALDLDIQLERPIPLEPSHTVDYEVVFPPEIWGMRDKICNA